MNSKLTWASWIPLNGGFPIAVEQELNKPPEYVVSYPGFWANDSMYMNWLKQNGHNVPYHTFDELNPPKLNPVDIIVAVPPCAALSNLNTGTSPASKGAGCAKNDWMYLTAEHAIKYASPKVIIIENAPALYTEKGTPVREKITSIAHDFGYSITFYKTNSLFHGIPQKRERTFAFIWKSSSAPILEWIRKDCPTFAEYLAKIPSTATYHDMFANPKIVSEPFYRYIKDKYGDVRSTVNGGNVVTPIEFVTEVKKELNEFIEWANKRDDKDAIKRGNFVKSKFDANKGVWDNSARFFTKYMNACVSRNLYDTMHPIEERPISVREVMHMMCLPHEYQYPEGMDPITHINKCAQSVPVTTGRGVVQQAIKFIEGKLEMTETNLMMQNNCAMRNDTKLIQKTGTLEEFF